VIGVQKGSRFLGWNERFGFVQHVFSLIVIYRRSQVRTQ